MKTNHPAKTSRHFTLLGWFVLLSILAHGLFLAIPGNKPDNKLHVELSSPLQVTVISSRSASGSTQAGAVENIPVTQQRTSQKEPVAGSKTSPLSAWTAGKADPDNKDNTRSIKSEDRSIASNFPVKTTFNSKNDTEQFTDKNTSTNIETENTKNVPLNHLRRQLKETIRARFTYPRMAQRMGWQGQVGLSLHIENDGSLNQVRVARSSGHKVLDENARKTIQSIGRLQVASNMTVQAVDTEIEILYRLTD